MATVPRIEETVELSTPPRITVAEVPDVEVVVGTDDGFAQLMGDVLLDAAEGRVEAGLAAKIQAALDALPAGSGSYSPSRDVALPNAAQVVRYAARRAVVPVTAHRVSIPGGLTDAADNGQVKLALNLGYEGQNLVGGEFGFTVRRLDADGNAVGSDVTRTVTVQAWSDTARTTIRGGFVLPMGFLPPGVRAVELVGIDPRNADWEANAGAMIEWYARSFTLDDGSIVGFRVDGTRLTLEFRDGSEVGVNLPRGPKGDPGDASGLNEAAVARLIVAGVFADARTGVTLTEDQKKAARDRIDAEQKETHDYVEEDLPPSRPWNAGVSGVLGTTAIQLPANAVTLLVRGQDDEHYGEVDVAALLALPDVQGARPQASNANSIYGRSCTPAGVCTEWAVGHHGRTIWWASRDVGSGTLAFRYRHEAPISADRLPVASGSQAGIIDAAAFNKLQASQSASEVDALADGRVAGWARAHGRTGRAPKAAMPSDTSYGPHRSDAQVNALADARIAALVKAAARAGATVRFTRGDLPADLREVPAVQSGDSGHVLTAGATGVYTWAAATAGVDAGAVNTLADARIAALVEKAGRIGQALTDAEKLAFRTKIEAEGSRRYRDYQLGTLDWSNSARRDPVRGTDAGVTLGLDASHLVVQVKAGSTPIAVSASALLALTPITGASTNLVNGTNALRLVDPGTDAGTEDDITFWVAVTAARRVYFYADQATASGRATFYARDPFLRRYRRRGSTGRVFNPHDYLPTDFTGVAVGDVRKFIISIQAHQTQFIPEYTAMGRHAEVDVPDRWILSSGSTPDLYSQNVALTSAAYVNTGFVYPGDFRYPYLALNFGAAGGNIDYATWRSAEMRDLYQFGANAGGVQFAVPSDNVGGTKVYVIGWNWSGTPNASDRVMLLRSTEWQHDSPMPLSIRGVVG